MTPTGQFRAMPDASQNTAQFRAFASRYGSEADQSWGKGASGRSSARVAAIAIGVAVLLAVIIVLAVTL